MSFNPDRQQWKAIDNGPEWIDRHAVVDDRGNVVAKVNGGIGQNNAGPASQLMAASSQLFEAAKMNAIDAAAAVQLWRLMKHGTDPAQAVRATLEIVERIRSRSEAAIAKATGGAR